MQYSICKMPKLYYSKTSCSAASFISAFTAKVNIETEQVDHDYHTDSGVDFKTINPKGNVPTLVLDDGTVLNENISILQYIADLATPGTIAPANGTNDRAKLQNVLSYIATELHPSLAFQFPGYIYKNITAETLSFFRELSLKKFDYLENHLIGDKQFVVGDSFTVADAYLYVILTWTFPIGIDLSPYPKVKAYFGRIGALENVLGAYARIATKPTTSI